MAVTLGQADYNELFYNSGGAIGGYDNYGVMNHQYAIDAANLLITKFLANSGLTLADLVGKRVLVIGCGYGHLVKYLVDLYSVNAIGFDWSSYAISQVPAEIAGRIFLGDARVQATYTQAKTLAGITKPNERFDLTIDEDMLCCLTDADALTARNLMLQYSNMVYHLVMYGSHQTAWYNYKDITAWKALTGNSPKERWYARFTGSEV